MSDKLEKELQRAAEAQQLIENPIFRETIDALEKELDDLSLTIPTTDRDLCADVIMRRQVFESIKMKIIHYIQTGKMAAETLKDSQPREKELTR